MKTNKIKWIFYGTTEFSVIVLEELRSKGFVPSLVVTVPDRPKGRYLATRSPSVKVWAERESVLVIQPEKLSDLKTIEEIKKYSADVFVVFSYGKIIPQNILDIPKHGTLNLHPSLLPKLRGPSPIKSAILSENETGVTIIKLDAEMDHGPILAQENVEVSEWPPYESDLENKLAHEGGKLLAKILPDWVAGKIEGKEQNHTEATYCKMIEKKDGEINLEDNAELNLRKIRAFHIWPTSYFYHANENTHLRPGYGGQGKRIIIKRAHIENGQLVLDSVVPEGKKEMSYRDFLRGKK